MDIRQYFKNVSFLFIINILIKPIWVFGVERKFQLCLGQESYGFYFSNLSLMYILYVALDMGLHNYSVKLISESTRKHSEIVSELWMSKLILCVLFIILVGICIGLQKLTPEKAMVFVLISLEMLAFSLYQFLRCIIQGLQMFKTDSILSVLDRLLLIGFGSGILLLFENENISLHAFILFHIAAYILCFSIVYYQFRDRLSFVIDAFHIKQLSQIVRGGYPLIIVTIMMSIYTRIDAVLLSKLIENGNKQCGILAYSNSIVDSTYNALSLLSVFLLPTVANHYKKDYAYVVKVVIYSFLSCTLITILFLILCRFYSSEIYEKLYHTQSSMAIDVFRTQIWAIIGVGWMYIFGSYLTATGKFFQLIAISATGVLMSLVLNFSWIPQFGAMGVAYSSAMVQTTMGIVYLLTASYYLYRARPRQCL